MPKSKEFCTFVLEDHLFGVDVQKVQEIIRYQEMTRVPLANGVVRGLINLRGQIVLALDLRKRLNLAEAPSHKLPINVIVKTEEGPISLLVDEIGDVLEVDESLYEPNPETLKGIDKELAEGTYKLKTKLSLVLHLEKTINI